MDLTVLVGGSLLKDKDICNKCFFNGRCKETECHTDRFKPPSIKVHVKVDVHEEDDSGGFPYFY